MLLCPTIKELTNGEFNRYELVVAVAKGTRMVTDENLERQKDITTYGNGEMSASTKGESYMGYTYEKAMTTVVKRIKSGEYKITYRINEE